MTADFDDRLLSQKELAERWGVTLRTLRNWNLAGKGPKRLDIARISYRLSDVIRYEEEQAVPPTAKPKQVFKEEYRAKGTEAAKLAREARKATKPTE